MSDHLSRPRSLSIRLQPGQVEGVSEHVCASCQTAWTHQPRPGLRVAGYAIIAVSVAAAFAMLFLIKEGNTTVGGGAGVVAMVALGVGMKLTSKTILRCPNCSVAAGP